MAMKMATTIQWGGEEFDKQTTRRVQKELRDIGSDLARKLRASLRARSGRKEGRSVPGSVPAMFTGRLSKAVTRDNRGLRKKKPWVRVGIDFKEARYAGILEFGGEVKARGGKNLTIPLNPEAEAILKNKEHGGLLRSMLETGELETVTDKKGRKWIVKPGVSRRKHESGTEQAGEFMFLLQKSIRIPAHPFVRPLAMKERDGIIRRLNNAVAETASGFDVNKGGAQVTKWAI